MRTVVLKLALFASEQERAASEEILRLLLETLTRANEIWLRAHPHTPDLYRAGVVYQRERPHIIGQPIPEVWKTIPYVRKDGQGDCEDLACWFAAQWRVRRGVHVVPDFIYRRVGNLSVYHIFDRFPDGRVEDPSRVLGMKAVA